MISVLLFFLVFQSEISSSVSSIFYHIWDINIKTNTVDLDLSTPKGHCLISEESAWQFYWRITMKLNECLVILCPWNIHYDWIRAAQRRDTTYSSGRTIATWGRFYFGATTMSHRSRNNVMSTNDAKLILCDFGLWGMSHWDSTEPPNSRPF